MGVQKINDTDVWITTTFASQLLFNSSVSIKLKKSLIGLESTKSLKNNFHC